MSTFYAAFPDSIKAQQMVRQLLDDGVNLDDLSLVSRTVTDLEGAAAISTGDATTFVGRPDDPDHPIVDERSHFAEYEEADLSPIGAGISTSDRRSDAETVDQMENSQELAEEEGWPLRDASHSRQELDDVDRMIATGFESPVTPTEEDLPSSTEADRSFEAVLVRGVGLVIGGGDLSTSAFDWAGKNGEPDASAFLTYLQDEGIPPREANDFLAQYGNGGAIMAVAGLPEINDDALEEVAERFGAVSTGWYGAPRF